MQMQEAGVCIFSEQKKTQGLSDRDRCKQRHTVHLPRMPPPPPPSEQPYLHVFLFFFLFWEEIHFTLGYNLLKKKTPRCFPPFLFEKSSVGISSPEATFPLQL